MAELLRSAQETTESLATNAEFERYLNDTIPKDEILKYHKMYIKGSEDEDEMLEIRFDYAVALIGSRSRQDMRKGLLHIQGLINDNPKENGQYFYYMSLGFARLEQYNTALRFLSVYPTTYPGCVQIVDWRKFLEAKMQQKDATRKCLGVTTGTALAIGGLVGLSLVLLKLRRFI